MADAFKRGWRSVQCLPDTLYTTLSHERFPKVRFVEQDRRLDSYWSIAPIASIATTGAVPNELFWQSSLGLVNGARPAIRASKAWPSLHGSHACLDQPYKYV